MRPDRSPIWRILRRLLPRRYRERWAGALLQAHVDRTGGGEHAGGIGFWCRVAVDVLLTTGQLLRDGAEQSRNNGKGRTMGRTSRVANWWWDVRVIARGLLRSPGYSIGVVMILTLGIGANMTIFTVLDRLLLSAPPHLEAPEELRRINVFGVSIFAGDEPVYSASLSYPDYRALARTPGLELAGLGGRELTLEGEGRAERVQVEFATASYFPLLGVTPALGSFYGPDQDRLGVAEPAAVLSYGFWQRRFGGDPGVLGTRLDLGRGSYRVSGVAPRGFTGVDIAPVDLWVPFMPANELESGDAWLNASSWPLMRAIGRVEPGSEEVVEAAATTLFRAGREGTRVHDPEARIALSSIVRAKGPNPSAESRVARLLTALTALVLLIGAANVSNLQLARGVVRRREIAVRSALGVSRDRLFVHLLTEVGILAGVAAVLSAWLGFYGGRALFSYLLPDAVAPASLDLRAMAVAGGLMLLSVVLAGLLPALRGARVDLTGALRGHSGGPSGGRLRRALILLQTSLSVVILVMAGLFVQSARTAAEVDLGFDPETLVVGVEIEGGETFGSEVGQVVAGALPAVRGLPGVTRAAAATLGPLSGLWGISVARPGADPVENSPEGPLVYGVTGDYFEVLGVEIVRGRPLTDDDGLPGAEPVTVVGERLAERLWPGEDPLGRCLIPRPDADGSSCATVVGVAADMRSSVEAEEDPLLVYLPPLHPALGEAGTNTYLVETAPGFGSTDIVRAIGAASPRIRLATGSTLRDRVAPQLRSWRLGATLLSVFGVLALVVSAAGLYATLAFEVAQRRRELSLRSALGAPRARVVRTTVMKNLATVGLGLLLGIGLGILVGRLTRALLFGVEPTDPVVALGVVGVLLTTSLMAVALPALRVTRLDPATVLKED